MAQTLSLPRRDSSRRLDRPRARYRSLWPRNDPADILQEDEQMHRVGRGGVEFELRVEGPGLFIFGLDRKRADASDLGGL